MKNFPVVHSLTPFACTVYSFWSRPHHVYHHDLGQARSCRLLKADTNAAQL
jgi:hypothetical protein